MKTSTYQMDVEKMLDKIFAYLVESGLGNISIRDVCKQTGISQGSLYYWFSDRSAIICEATEHGLRKVTDEIFNYVFANIQDLDLFFTHCLDKIDEYKKELRYIYQMAASPVYGEKIRHDGKYFKSMYDEYAEKLAKQLDYDEKKVKPLVYLFVSAILDYAVWDDKENVQTEIDFIYANLSKLV